MTVDVDHLILLAEQDPRRCVMTCHEILADGASEDQHPHAHRALGIALRSLGEVEESIRHLELALDQYRAIGDDTAGAEATISLAASVAVSGKLAEGVELLESVLVDEQVSVRAHAQVQKAGLIARSGDLHGAMALYAEAQPVLEELEDLRWLALLHSTRGMVQTLLSDFGPAEADFRLARDLFLELDRPSSAAEMEHNLGYAAVESGDLARGLRLLLRAEELFTEAGLPVEAISSDRAHAYMLAGLPGEAYRVASRLAQQLAKQGRELERSETLYLAARAALNSGDAETAVQVAEEAARVAADQGRPTWEMLAAVVREQACFRAGLPGDPDKLVGLAGDLAESGMSAGATRALALAALRHLEVGDIADAERVLADIASDEGGQSELSVHLLVAVARARLSLARNESEAAAATLEEAADLVDRQRILLSATEARAGVSRLAEEIVALGLEAMHETTPSVIAWVERFRGASLRVAPVVMSSDTELALTLAELRPVVRDLMAAPLTGEDTTEMVAERLRLEKRVRDLAMASDEDAEGSAEAAVVNDIIEALGPRHMLYIYDVGGLAYGEAVGSEGIGRVELGASERLRFLGGHLLSALRRGFMQGRTSEVVHEMISELALTIIAPGVGAGADLVVVPPPELLGLPWTAMGRSVDPGLSVTVAPSAGMWARADGLARRQASLGVVAGPRLEFAASEAGRVAGLFDDEAEQLAGTAATVEAMLQTMGRCDRLHAVAHTLLRDDNPMFSSLELADGFLNLYDLEGLESVPDTVVLSACDSAHDNVVGGYEMYGLTSVLLSRGTRSVIATVAPIPDSAESVEAVVRIHTALKEGATAAAAVRDAQIGFDDTVDPSVAFVAYGA